MGKAKQVRKKKHPNNILEIFLVSRQNKTKQHWFKNSRKKLSTLETHVLAVLFPNCGKLEGYSKFS